MQRGRLRMKVLQVSWSSGLLVLFLFAAAAAELPALNCSVTKLPNGSFRYRLSGPGGSPNCSTCWEDHERNVIARDSVFNRTLVQNLSDDFIDLNTCQNHLRHRTECFWNKRAVDCRVNCSFFDGSPPNTKFCLTSSWCLDPVNGGLLVGLLAAAVVLVLVVLFVVIKLKQRKAASYTPTVQMDLDSKESDPPTKTPDLRGPQIQS